VLGDVPDFTLTERHGAPLTERDLRGKVWVANFVFTRCVEICPVLTQRMGELQRTLAKTAPGAVTLVSISVDPTFDTPEVLRGYADAHAAAPGWLFATGTRDDTAHLLRDGFHVAFADDGPAVGPITHSDRFVLVDRALAIRGYYHGNDPDDLRRLATDAAALAAAG